MVKTPNYPKTFNTLPPERGDGNPLVLLAAIGLSGDVPDGASGSDAGRLRAVGLPLRFRVPGSRCWVLFWVLGSGGVSR
jgi:hypothetical protein